MLWKLEIKTSKQKISECELIELIKDQSKIDNVDDESDVVDAAKQTERVSNHPFVLTMGTSNQKRYS